MSEKEPNIDSKDKNKAAVARYQAKTHLLRVRIPLERADELSNIIKSEFDDMSIQAFILSAIDEKIATRVDGVPKFYKPSRTRSMKQIPQEEALYKELVSYIKENWPDKPIKVEPQRRLRTAFQLDKRFSAELPGIDQAAVDFLTLQAVDCLIVNADNNEMICCVERQMTNGYGVVKIKKKKHDQMVSELMEQIHVPLYYVKIESEFESIPILKNDTAFETFLNESINQYFGI